MKKKMIALVLALAMMLSLTQGAFAAEPEEITEEQIQAEIQARTEEVYNLVYAQLEAQNAVHMIDDFMEIFAPEIEFEIMQKYNMGIVPYSGGRIFNFPYGGMVHYETASGNEIIAVYYDEDDTTKYFESKEEVIVLRDSILEILGYIPDYGKYFDALSKILTYIDATVKADIENAGGYARITNIYDPDSGMVSAAFGWYTYPSSITYSDSVNILNREFFPSK